MSNDTTQDAPQNAEQPPDELLTTAQAAEVLAVSPQTLRLWRSTGDGPPYLTLTERTIRYRRTEIDRWLSTRKTTPQDLTSSNLTRTG